MTHIQTKRRISRFHFSTGPLDDAAIRASVTHFCVSHVQHVTVNAIPAINARASHERTCITTLCVLTNYHKTRLLLPVLIPPLYFNVTVPHIFLIEPLRMYTLHTF